VYGRTARAFCALTHRSAHSSRAARYGVAILVRTDSTLRLTRLSILPSTLCSVLSPALSSLARADTRAWISDVDRLSHSIVDADAQVLLARVHVSCLCQLGVYASDETETVVLKQEFEDEEMAGPGVVGEVTVTKTETETTAAKTTEL
jgi:hypothetical protein